MFEVNVNITYLSPTCTNQNFTWTNSIPLLDQIYFLLLFLHITSYLLPLTTLLLTSYFFFLPLTFHFLLIFNYL